jgi:hypothetical protein
LFRSQTFAINMQIKTALFIALAIGCASAENASTTPNSGMLMVNPTSGNCVTMLGSTADPFNALNMQTCTGNVTQLWTLNPSDNSLCVQAKGGFCVWGGNVPAPGSGSSAFMVVHPTERTYFEYNPTSLSIYVAGSCGSMIDITSYAYDGSKPMQIYSPSDFDCNSPDEAQLFKFESPTTYLATSSH